MPPKVNFNFANTLFAKPDFRIHRAKSGAPVVADSADLTVLLTAELARSAIDCNGFETVKGYIKFTGGTSPTLDLAAVELANDETESKFVSTTETALAVGADDTFELTINGGKLFVRIAAVSGAPTKAVIYLAGAKKDNVSNYGRAM